MLRHTSRGCYYVVSCIHNLNWKEVIHADPYDIIATSSSWVCGECIPVIRTALLPTSSHEA